MTNIYIAAAGGGVAVLMAARVEDRHGPCPEVTLALLNECRRNEATTATSIFVRRLLTS